MGMAAASNSSRRKNPSEERKRKKKAGRKAKSSKRRRHDSPSPSSGSDRYSSPSAFSSDLEGGGGQGSRGRNSEKKVLVKRRRSPSPDGAPSRRLRKKKKKGSYQGGSRRKLSEGKNQKKGHDRSRRRRRRRSSSSRSTSVSSPDDYSSRSCSTRRGRSSSPKRLKLDRSLRSKGRVAKASLSARSRSSSRREKEGSGRRPSPGGHRYGSPSCSSCSRYSQEGRSISRSQGRGSGSGCHHSEGRLAEKKHSRHPLSASTTAEHLNEMEDRYYSGRDENRAGIVEEFDYLHTSRSNDSYDGRQKRDGGMALLSPLQHPAERRSHNGSSADTGRNEHANEAEPDLKRDFPSSVVASGLDGDAQWGNKNGSPMPRDTQPRLKSLVSTSGGGSEADELELLLRQKALENFKKFRSRISTTANSVVIHKRESIPIKAHEVTSGKLHAVKFHESARPVAVPAKQQSYTSVKHHIPAHDGSESISDADAHTGRLPGKTERDNKKRLQWRTFDAVNTVVAPDGSFSSSDLRSKEIQDESSGKIFGEDFSSKNILDKKDSAKAGGTDIHKKDGNRVDASASTDTSCHKSASEFEKKTMSVMHGGEVVQVSYKVYIPKKTPALARRRLEH